MKRTLLALSLAALAAPLFATDATDAHKLVARINGKEITNAELDAQWERVPQNLQDQYRKFGGKKAFLDNYISKQLIVMDAVASGFAEKAGVPADLEDAEAESALFDKYVREVVAASIITEGEMQRVYNENRAQFTAPEQAHLSIIRQEKGTNPDAARSALEKVVVEIFSARTALASQVAAEQLGGAMARKFAEIAARASDDPSAAKGGDLGWVALHTLDPRIAGAARTMRKGTVSGILESREAYQLVLIHDYRPSGVEPYDTAQDAIREFLMVRNSKKVMQAVKAKTDALRAAGKVEVFAENLK